MRRIALIAFLLALALAAAGCGAGDATDTETAETETSELEAAPIGAAQVVQEFLATEEAGLEQAAGNDPAWTQLSLGLDQTPAEAKRYGTFSIYVVEAGNEEAVESLLTDKETLRPLEPDARGIRWDLDELAGSYVAYKQYGPNVVLAWWNERPEPGVDARWRRLDALLSSLASR